MTPRKTRSRKKAADSKFDIYQHVTDEIVAKLEQGIVPWRRPWKGGYGDDGLQRNLVTRKAYRGINQFMLPLAGYDSPYWMSFKQATDLGGTVRKGERSQMVVFWRFVVARDEDKPEQPARRIGMLRYFRVFNLEQVDGIDAPEAKPVPEFEPQELGDAILCMPHQPEIRHQGDRAYYQPSTDVVTLPHAGAFRTPEHYYATAFHELAHATGHSSRLDREGIRSGSFGDETYSREELIAEMAANMVMRRQGLNADYDNSAAYIANWLQVFRDDRKVLISAAGAAQHAADWIVDDYTGPQHEQAADAEAVPA